MKSPIHWINTLGGPYVLMDIDTASRWRGIHGVSLENHKQFNSDYDIACNGTAYLRTIDVSLDRKILVIGDLPSDIMLLSNSETFFYLVKWIGANSDEQILSALVDINELPFDALDAELNVTSHQLVLFDSSVLISEAMDNKIIINTPVGKYMTGVLNYEPNDELMLQLFKFTLAC